MRITYRNEELKALCEREKEQKRQLGLPCAKKLQRRLADIAAAARVTDLAAGRPHELDRDRAGQFAQDLEGGRRLVFEPANVPIPRRDNTSIAWDQVTEVRIVFVGDYHD
jgi:proteic killer suppression protein